MRKLELLFLVGFGYVWALWFNQGDLHSPVPLVVLPLWIWLILRAACFYVLLLFLAVYAPGWRLWLAGRVRQLIESEDWNV
jgi:hypothetical protein